MAKNDIEQTQVENMVDSTFELLAGYKDEEGKIHKKVEIREMTGEDEEKIAGPQTRGNLGKIITALLSNCILRIGEYERADYITSNPGRKKWEGIIRDLYAGDREYAMMNIIKATYCTEEDPTLEFTTQCRNPNCQEEIIVTFNYDELGINELEVEDPENIPFELPKGYFDKSDGTMHKKGTLRLPKGVEQEQLDSEARKNLGVANTSLITRCVKELGEARISSQTFRQLSLKDRRHIMEVITDSTFGPNLTIDVICEECGHEFEAGVNPLNFI